MQSPLLSIIFLAAPFINHIFSICQWNPLFSSLSVARVHRFVFRAAREHLNSLHLVNSCGGRLDGQIAFECLQHSNNLCDRLYSCVTGKGTRPPPLVAALLALPSAPPSRCDFLRCLPRAEAEFYADPGRVLADAAVVADRRRQQPTLVPYVGASTHELCATYSRLDTLSMIDWCLAKDATVVNGIFAVPKELDSSGAVISQRLIIDARIFNMLCVLAALLNLPNPADLGRLFTSSLNPLFMVKFDISNYYHHLFVPSWMHRFLCLPAVPARLMGPAFSTRFGGPDVMISPFCLTLPMGWVNAVHVAQNVTLFLLSSTSIGRQLQLVGPGSSCEVGGGRYFPYVDDIVAISGDALLLDSGLLDIQSTFARAGLPSNEPKLITPTTAGVALGLAFDGVRHEWRPRPEKLTRLLDATRWVLHRRFLSSKGLQILVSHWIWFALLFRPSLAIFSAVFAFIQKFKFDLRPHLLWHGVRGELEAMCRVAPLMVARMRTPFFRKVVCSDACPTGAGVCTAPLSAEAQSQLHVWFSERRAADLNPQARQLFQTHFPGALWHPIFSFKWRFPEHINALEFRILVDAIRWVISHPGDAVRVAAFVDSQVVQSIVGKGRTSAPSLIHICRRLSSYLLATGINLSTFYVPTDLNPADGPSRRPRPHYNVWSPS